MNDEDKKPPRRVGVDSDDSISFDLQFEYEKILAEIRVEKDPVIVMNILFELITKLSSIIDSYTDKQEIRDKLEKENERLDSDEFSPKTKIFKQFGEYIMRFDSYTVKCSPPEYPASLEQLNRERNQVTTRKLWAMLGRLQTIAYREGIFVLSFTLKGDKKHGR